MRHVQLTALVMALLVLGAGCSKKAPREVPPPPIGAEGSTTDAGTADPGATGADAEGALGTMDPGGMRGEFLRAVPSDRILFETDSYGLDAEDRAVLDAQAAWLVANPGVAITIEGHCDERGTREYNLALGERRAHAARNHLAGRGVDPSRMSVLSWGKERPVSEGSSDEAWAQNRRAVTVLPN